MGIWSSRKWMFGSSSFRFAEVEVLSKSGFNRTFWLSLPLLGRRFLFVCVLSFPLHRLLGVSMILGEEDVLPLSLLWPTTPCGFEFYVDRPFLVLVDFGFGFDVWLCLLDSCVLFILFAFYFISIVMQFMMLLYDCE